MSRRFSFWQLALLIAIGLEVASLHNAYTLPPAKPVVVEHLFPAKGGVSQTAYVCDLTGSRPCLVADGSNIHQLAAAGSRHAILPAPRSHQ